MSVGFETGGPCSKTRELLVSSSSYDMHISSSSCDTRLRKWQPHKHTASASHNMATTLSVDDKRGVTGRVQDVLDPREGRVYQQPR